MAKSNVNLLRGLSVLKEEIMDTVTGRPCTVCKAWNTLLHNYGGNKDELPGLLCRIEERFPMEPYQMETIKDLAKVLVIIDQ